MIALELILPTRNKKLCMTVGETTSVGEFKKYLRHFFDVNNERIFMLSGTEITSDEISLSEAGMFTGSGVIIDDERSYD